MKHLQIILFSSGLVNFEEVRKEAKKLAKMFLDAEIEEDSSKQKSLLAEAEKFSRKFEDKYRKADSETYRIINQIMNEEADILNRNYFGNFSDDDDDEF
jgi:hypothetical protein